MATHGMHGTKVYKAWLEIKRRCYNSKSTSYSDYGGRGILFEEYKNDFQAFLLEVGEPPSEKHSINRIDNTLGYVKGNMEWATPRKQIRNRRKMGNNTSGHTGVSLRRVRRYPYYVAEWYSAEGKHIRKYFSISKLGKEQAYRKAVECRLSAIQELNEKGAEYGISHGQ